MPKARQDNTLPVITHVLGYFSGFIGPLVVLLVSKDENVRNHARTALNWQFSAMIYSVVSAILIFVFVGILLLAAISIVNIVFVIMAAVKASSDELWHYPMSIPFFKVKA